MTKKILFVIGHPDFATSIVNKKIVEELKKKHFPNATFSNLVELYPDSKINIEAEQKKLVAADIVVFIFPLFWFSVPTLLKKYFDDVFQHGFSHGTNGDKLKGKKFIISSTTGAPEEIYKKEGLLKHTLDDYLLSVQQSGLFAGMIYSGAVYSYGVSYALRTQPNFKPQAEEKAVKHAQKLIALIEKA